MRLIMGLMLAFLLAGCATVSVTLPNASIVVGH